MKVLHVLDHSLPLHSGYAFRSDSILRALNSQGIETIQITGPKFGMTESVSDVQNGVTYQRTPVSSGEEIGSGSLAQIACVRRLREQLKPIVAREKPDVIHAHSPCLDGLAALGLGIPVVYEIRATWEDAAVSSGTTKQGSLRYRITRALETFTARRVNSVVTICEGLKSEMRRRGIPASKIQVVGNAVELSSFRKSSDDTKNALRNRLGLVDQKVLGFFGSFYAYEGLSLLIEAMSSLVKRRTDVVLLLAGGGEEESSLKRMVSENSLGDYVRFVGRVPHNEISGYYGIADFMVFPRQREKVTELVTPLKPLEAMYTNCVVVASDVGGHKELIEDGVTGHLFRAGDATSLEAKLEELLNDDVLCAKTLNAGEAYLLSERTWDSMAKRYVALYESMLNQQSRY